LQIFWKKQIERLGARYYVVDGLDAIANVVNDARLELGGDAK
jgi:hypothetical protein